MKFKQTKLAVAVGTATLAMAGALVAPQTFAGDRSAQASDAKIRALEAQMNQMRQMMSQMQSELSATKQQDPKVQELDDWMQSMKSAPVKAETKDNMVFFRGGYARNDNTRNGVSIYSDVALSSAAPGVLGGQPDKDAWYFGAGFDFSLNDDLFGFMDDTEVLAELMFEYKKFGYVQGNALTQEPTLLATGALATPRNVTVNQFTLTASPKIKFMKDSAFRPWLIPVGFAMHVVSPPSESITVLNPGMMFGAGADYKIWKDIYVGADARYHLTASDADGVDTDGFTAGGYLGIGF